MVNLKTNDTTKDDVITQDGQPLLKGDYPYNIDGIGNSVYLDNDSSRSGTPNANKVGNVQWNSEKPKQNLDLSEMKRDGLSFWSISAYSLGHFNNDLVAGLGFTYQTYYLQDVLKISQVVAGFTLLSGQITDGITTPLIGMASDSCNTRIGKRTPWYILGSILVIPSFIGIFVDPGFEGSAQSAYYIILPAILNVGWAFVQISNMSIVNSLTSSSQRRDKLISLRNGFSYIANVLVLAISLIVFATVKDQILQFRILCLLLGAIGLCTSIFYIFSINEPLLTKQAKESQREYLALARQQELEDELDDDIDRDANPRTSSLMKAHISKWYMWLKEGQFYIYGMAYMLVRVAVNVTMTVQPFYLIYVTGFEKTEENPTPLSLAIVPLLSFITSMLFSIFLYKRIMNKFKNRQTVLLAAIVQISIGSIPFILLTPNPNTRWLVYLISPIQGIGMAMMLNTATSCISDVIGKSDGNSAFVYGAYGFFDKVANGVSLFYITAYLNTDPTALRWIIGLTPPLCAVGAFVACAIGQRKYSSRLAALSVQVQKRPKKNKDPYNNE